MKKEKKTTGFWADFKKFISRGSVIDLAVGIIIGTAFTAIVNSLVADILMPFIGLFVKSSDLSTLVIEIGSAKISVGLFIGAVINFFLIALVIFLIVRGINKLYKKPAPPQTPTKTCPFCKSAVNAEATRCPFCTSVLPEEQPPAPTAPTDEEPAPPKETRRGRRISL